MTQPASLPPPPDPRPDWAWFLDVDGTLIEIAPTPSAISIPVWLPDLLQQVATRHAGALAVVSGRSLANLRQLFAPFDPPAAGLHGLERRNAAGADLRANPPAGWAEARQRLHDGASAWDGVLVEDKGLALALHYRNAPEREADCRALAEAVVGGQAELSLLAGKKVFEIKPFGFDKGNAVREFMAEPPFAGRVPVFIGDDVTDEDGFAAANALGGLSVLVGELRPTQARHHLADIEACHAWLARAAGREWQPHMGEGGD